MAMPIQSADGNPGITALLGEIKALTFPKSLDGLSGEIMKKERNFLGERDPFL